MNIVSNIVSWAATVLAVLLLAGFIAWFTVPRLIGLEPQVVLSGSMEPAMPTGSVVFVKDKEAARVRPGDILTFRNPDNPQQRVSHRVTEVVTDANGLAFRTKGDANETADQWLVPAANVVGTVQWTVPYMGRVTRRVQTPQGFLLVIGLPAAMLIAAEIRNISSEMRKGRERKEAAS